MLQEIIILLLKIVCPLVPFSMGCRTNKKLYGCGLITDLWNLDIYNHDVHEVLSVTYLIGLEQSHLVLVYNERFFWHQNSINKLMFNTFPADIVILGYSVFILLLMKTV